VETDPDAVGWGAMHRETAIACLYSNGSRGCDRMTDAGLWTDRGDYDWLTQPVHGVKESLQTSSFDAVVVRQEQFH
jgi:hypothetical protein